MRINRKLREEIKMRIANKLLKEIQEYNECEKKIGKKFVSSEI